MYGTMHYNQLRTRPNWYVRRAKVSTIQLAAAFIVIAGVLVNLM